MLKKSAELELLPTVGSAEAKMSTGVLGGACALLLPVVGVTGLPKKSTAGAGLWDVEGLLGVAGKKSSLSKNDVLDALLVMVAGCCAKKSSKTGWGEVALAGAGD